MYYFSGQSTVGRKEGGTCFVRGAPERTHSPSRVNAPIKRHFIVIIDVIAYIPHGPTFKARLLHNKKIARAEKGGRWKDLVGSCPRPYRIGVGTLFATTELLNCESRSTGCAITPDDYRYILSATPAQTARSLVSKKRLKQKDIVPRAYHRLPVRKETNGQLLQRSSEIELVQYPRCSATQWGKPPCSRRTYIQRTRFHLSMKETNRVSCACL